jgi:hypothetical protein
MIGFSIASFSQNSGIICLNSELKTEFFAYNSTNVQAWIQSKIFDSHETICSIDSRQIYQALKFLDIEYLKQLNIFDCRAFLNVYRNATNIDIPKLADDQFGLNLSPEKERIDKIWFLQGERNWEYIPISLIEVFLLKESLAAFKIGWELKKIVVPIDVSNYMDFFKEFLIYLTMLEEVGITNKTTKILEFPRYEYDKSVTGRLINTFPICFQTMSSEKIGSLYTSRFGKDGILLVADWKNADFRVAASLSQEKLDEEKKDPYTLFARKSLGKAEISKEERDQFKDMVLTVMYDKDIPEGFAETYPKIASFKKASTEFAKKYLKISSHFGKTRFFGKNDKFETKAFNSICQMTVADLCKKAIIEMQKVLAGYELKSKMIPIVIYDQFAFDVHLSEKDQMLELIQNGLISATIPSSFKQYTDFEVTIKNINGDSIYL